MSSKLERIYQSDFLGRLEDRFPNAVYMKNDSGYRQGFPDWLVLHGPCWAVLEIKRERPTSLSDFEPNQPWWLENLNHMSYAACVFPENEQEVLDDLERLFFPRRKARNSQR